MKRISNHCIGLRLVVWLTGDVIPDKHVIMWRDRLNGTHLFTVRMYDIYRGIIIITTVFCTQHSTSIMINVYFHSLCHCLPGIELMLRYTLLEVFCSANISCTWPRDVTSAVTSLIRHWSMVVIASLAWWWSLHCLSVCTAVTIDVKNVEVKIWRKKTFVNVEW